MALLAGLSPFLSIGRPEYSPDACSGKASFCHRKITPDAPFFRADPYRLFSLRRAGKPLQCRAFHIVEFGEGAQRYFRKTLMRDFLPDWIRGFERGFAAVLFRAGRRKGKTLAVNHESTCFIVGPITVS